MKHTLVANLYNPHEQSKEQLVERFVVRQDILTEIFHLIQSFDLSQPGPHYLIEGQRGAGKTSLLLRLSYEIEQDAELKDRLIPIVFKEEAYYGIRRLFNFWETVMCELAGKHQDFEGLYDHIQATYDGLRDYERVCFEAIIDALDRSDSKRLILFIDNLGEMLQNFSYEENQRFHDILLKFPHIRIFGTSSAVLEAFFSPTHPFHEFFEKKRLEGLNKEETYTLLRQLASVYDEEETMQRVLEQQSGRVESLRVLTGGVIRTIILLFEIFTEQEESHTLTDLDMVLDRVTPLYKHRMDDLTPLHREVVNTIALNWDALSAEDIAHKTRLSQDEVDTVLYELENVFVVERVETSAQQPFYRLKERFLNIWYLMRLSSGGSRAKVVWLVHFLESWYNDQDLHAHAKKHLQAVTSGQYQAQSAFFLTEAFARTGRLDLETEHQMIQATRKLLQEHDAHLAAELSESDRDIFHKGEAAYRNAQYQEAITHFSTIKHQNQHIAFRLGYAYLQLKDVQHAMPYLSQAAGQGHGDAMLHLGELYQYHLQDYPLAEKYYRMASDKKLTEAMLRLGTLSHYALKKYQQAESSYMMVIKEADIRSKVLTSSGFSLKGLRQYLVTAIKGDIDDPDRYRIDDFPETKKDYLDAMKAATSEALFQLGNLYAHELQQTPKAEMYYLQAVEAGHVNAIIHLADLYNYRVKDYRKAEQYYLMAAEQQDVNAIVALGLLYHEEFKDYANAEKFYAMAAEQGEISAMNALAWLYFEQQKHKEKALQYVRKTLETEQNIYTAHTAACVYLWNNYVDEAIDLANRFMYSEDAQQALEKDILVYLMLLLAKECYSQLDTYFASPELHIQERFKPFYYACLHFADDPDYHKLPPELSELVQDIIRKVNQMKNIMN